VTPPKRYKDVEEYSPAEHEERQQAARQGKPDPKFETDEYRDARAKALARAGLEDEHTNDD